MIKLSKRLQTVASMVTCGHVTADIGCDHAHTGIWLLKNGISPKVIAMDLRKGPLEKAKENVAAEKMTEKIDLRLSDGLDSLEAGEADTILISGMGGPLILEILDRNLDKAKSAKELVLSPQSDLDTFEDGLAELGFSVIEKKIVKDEDKFYFVFKAVPDAAAKKTDKTAEPPEVWTEYLMRESKLKGEILKKLEGDSGEKAAARRAGLYNDIRRIEDEINRMRN